MELLECSFSCHSISISLSFSIIILGFRELPKLPSLCGRQRKTVQFFYTCGYLPHYCSASQSRPPTAPKKGVFSSVSAEETKCIERNSVRIRVRTVIKSPNDLQIHIRVSLTFRTVGIHHRFKKMISRFRSFVPLMNFSITNCCDAVL